MTATDSELKPRLPLSHSAGPAHVLATTENRSKSLDDGHRDSSSAWGGFGM